MRELFALGVGHATPLFIEIAEAAGWRVKGLYHYNDERTGEFDHGFQILGSFDDLFQQDIRGCNFLLTMGDMSIRKTVGNRILSFGGILPTLIHPSSHISRFSSISEEGVIIGNGVEIQNDVVIENNVVLRSNSVICHDSVLKSDVFIGPMALVGAFITIDELAYIGQGALLVSGKAGHIGANTLIGAQSMVTKPLPDNVVAVGSPARIIKQRN